MSDKISTVFLKSFPNLSNLANYKTLVGVRPFRKGGIRLQKQIIGNRTVIHNYGHGGAGVSLAPATAEEAAILAEKCSKDVEGKDRCVTVLGCGIIGLMTGLECVKRGFKVRIIADRIPQIVDNMGQKERLRMCTSEVAPGYWLPYHY